ncbi:styrene monooxygenase/indole monooxygenase family protein [Rhodococcus sp. IEGM 1307]|jgi:2-polyprenyl-6-methoxyphenol hydroxylase-like FAD-dependent oxidoreductase|uniref:styrene monooxygenase/indole monooxygenase family protein n=1 Tax=Rhodococcus sp. IEGM 1307 TaxID=3047091 RepID=UPI0024B65B1C|nr:styrene monooxygenase/indole monooxygenase family protein [Rhodococcus sp. IEGM 1307]MDI9973350.1 FAD-binding oxidoreductase [Rhodococcus sp. IEGM 1307]
MTSRSVTIVGAGQSGLQLAIGLLEQGFSVTVVSDRTGDEIAAGRVSSSQCMFDEALTHERRLGLDFWGEVCPDVDGISVAVPLPPQDGGNGGFAINWAARLERSAQSVDQRVKMPRFIEEFISRGGEFVVHTATVDDLERYSTESDLVIVAAGKGEIAKLFCRDAERSVLDGPQRALALTYVHGMRAREDFSTVGFNMLPGIGEYFSFPALTTSGPCDIMVFEAAIGGPMDRWTPGISAEQHLETSLGVLRDFLPWEAERCESVSLTDDLGVLAGRLTPTVRRPVATLLSGTPVLGMADVVVLNDPLTGQGSNNASKCAASYLDSIVARGDRAFDAEFQQSTFEKYWEYAQYVTAFTNSMLAPPPPHVLELLGAAGSAPELASRFVEGFNNPTTLFDWFTDPDEARKVLDTSYASSR